MRRLLLVLVIVSSLGRAAAAQDAFEIQVYDSETAPPGDTGVELHINHVAAGVTTLSAEGELPSSHVTHLTLEPHVGLTRWCEAGAYFQMALRPDGAFQYAGVKLRVKTRLPHRLRGLIGLALNAELSSVPRAYEATGLGGELRPVIDVEWRRLYASLNPIIGFDFFGPVAGHPLLEPAATALVQVLPGWQLGVEYYAALGPIDRPLAVGAEVHRLFAVSQLAYKWFGLQAGVGYGLTAGDRWVVKTIFAFDFGTR